MLEWLVLGALSYICYSLHERVSKLEKRDPPAPPVGNVRDTARDAKAASDRAMLSRLPVPTT